jgi:oligogalacturonide lyase
MQSRVSRRIRRTIGQAVAVAQRPVLRGVSSAPRVLIDRGEVAGVETVPARPPEKVTSHRDAHEQPLYFTTPSVTDEGSRLFLLSDRTGAPNLFVRDLESGQEQQLSDNRDGCLKSYVYFAGSPYRGLGIASPSLDARAGLVYYIQDRQIMVAGVNGVREVVATLPRDQMTAYTALSADGTRLCVATVDARALSGEERLRGQPEYGVARRMRRENLNSYLRVYRTRDGQELACEAVPGAWVTHVHFCPRNPKWILYNHEWSRESGVRRIWLWDGTSHRAQRTEANGRHRRDWVCHEFWTRDGQSILYHGRSVDGRDFVGRIRNNETVELPLPQGWRQYGHFHGLTDSCLVSDGYYRLGRGCPLAGCAWISRLNIDWEAGTIEWTPLTAHLSSWGSQDDHPHPRIDPSGRYAYFTSDRDGRRAVYRTPVLGT